MSDTPNLLILFPQSANDAEPPLQQLVDALGRTGARVQIHACDENFDEILDAVAQADKLVFWR